MRVTAHSAAPCPPLLPRHSSTIRHPPQPPLPPPFNPHSSPCTCSLMEASSGMASAFSKATRFCSFSASASCQAKWGWVGGGWGGR